MAECRGTQGITGTWYERYASAFSSQGTDPLLTALVFRMNQPAVSACPSPDRLIQLVSGSLMESDAEKLLAHIDACDSCQDQMDKLEKKQDPVIAAVKKAPRHETPPTQDAQLSELMRGAQRGSKHETRVSHESATRIVSEADFVQNLRRSGLMPQAEIDQLLSDLSWDRSKSSGDSSSLAKRLIHTERLTRFQARLLLRGRWKGLVLGNYTILDKLGQGGMGSVFKARHTHMGRIVCLKVVNAAGRQSPAVIDRFRNEARALASLSHPNIVVAHDANETRGIPYLVMEFIDGADLSKRIKSDRPVSVAETLKISIQTASALAYAHTQGVIHRDVKPHNIVAQFDSNDKTTHVKVLDLGLARFDSLISDNPDASILAAMTNTGVVIGTVDYMSPEQALDSRNADARSDIYSLGCTIYFLLIGRPPFEGETVMQRLVAHREERPRSLCSFMKSDITPELNAVVQKMLQKDPADRYQSMPDVIADLDALAEGRPPSVPLSTKSQEPVTPPPVAAGFVASNRQPEDSPDNELPTSLPNQLSQAIYGNLGPVYGRTIVAAGLIMLALAGPIAFFWPRADSVSIVVPPQRVGAARAIRNGGGGRALLVVSSRKFHQDEFDVIVDIMNQRDIDFVIASPNFGTTEYDFGAEIKASFLNINLSKAKPEEFDAVFFLGGEVWDLTKKNKLNHELVVRIVNEALENQTPITSCTNGCDPMFDGTKVGAKQYKNVPVRKSHSKEELAKYANELFGRIKPTESSSPPA